MASEAAGRMGLAAGQLVQELGWDEDVDDTLRVSIEEAIGDEMVEDAVDVVDAVVLWWRDDDGDVADGVVDSLTDLKDDGVVWLMTPKVGREGHVDPADVSEAAITAGLTLTSTADVSEEWTAIKLVRPRGGHR